MQSKEQGMQHFSWRPITEMLCWSPKFVKNWSGYLRCLLWNCIHPKSLRPCSTSLCLLEYIGCIGFDCISFIMRVCFLMRADYLLNSTIHKIWAEKDRIETRRGTQNTFRNSCIEAPISCRGPRPADSLCLSFFLPLVVHTQKARRAM